MRAMPENFDREVGRKASYSDPNFAARGLTRGPTELDVENRRRFDRIEANIPCPTLDQVGHQGHVLRMARIVNVAAAKAHLPELIERAANGETVILARAGKPRAKIVALDDKPSKMRVPGKGKGRFRMKKGFDEQLPESVLALFEGGTK
jgi:antitoxin (DNA-binding transcriptional repressor) of toxin-antitoxin stability system